jgi:hypothetical protein
VLVARRELFANRVPDVPGGGTVAYVNDNDHRYLDDVTHREEGGTPAIIESIRAGLVLQLKEAVGTDTTREQEERHLRRAVEAWRAEPGIELLGNLDADRISIVSFILRSLSGRFLHHNYVVALLNDLFGHPVPRWLLLPRAVRPPTARHRPRALARVRARDHRRLRGHQAGLGADQLQLLRLRRRRRLPDRGGPGHRPDGWKLLGDYRFDPVTGPWWHRDGVVTPPLSLRDVSYAGGRAAMLSNEATGGEEVLAEHLRDGVALLAATEGSDLSGHPGNVSADFEHLRWFELPASALS